MNQPRAVEGAPRGSHGHHDPHHTSNREPKPFTWTAAAETILEKVRRGVRTFEALD